MCVLLLKKKEKKNFSFSLSVSKVERFVRREEKVGPFKDSAEQSGALWRGLAERSLRARTPFCFKCYKVSPKRGHEGKGKMVVDLSVCVRVSFAQILFSSRSRSLSLSLHPFSQSVWQCSERERGAELERTAACLTERVVCCCCCCRWW